MALDNMKKEIIIIISVLLVIGMYLLIGNTFKRWDVGKKKMIDRCINYDPQWEGINDCYGLISIWFNDNEKYNLLNNIQANIPIAEIKYLDDFYLDNSGNMYVVDIRTHGICNNLEPGKYCGNFQVNGELKQYYYDTLDQVPKYLIIDTQTGNERFYTKLDEVPTNEQEIFQKLLQK